MNHTSLVIHHDCTSKLVNPGKKPSYPKQKNFFRDGTPETKDQTLPETNSKSPENTWMSQEVSHWLLNGLYYNLNIPHLKVGYNAFTNHLLTSWTSK